MPIFNYQCLECKHEFEKIVIISQTGMGEPDQCPKCKSNLIEKLLSAPAQIRMDGKAGLRSVPDPKPPLRSLQEAGPKPGCTGGYSDLPDFYKPIRKGKDKYGNILWGESPKKIVYDMKRNKMSQKQAIY